MCVLVYTQTCVYMHVWELKLDILGVLWFNCSPPWFLRQGLSLNLGHPSASVLKCHPSSPPAPSAGILSVHCCACFGVYVCAKDWTQVCMLLKIVLITIQYLLSLGSFFPQRWRFRGHVFRYWLGQMVDSFDNFDFSKVSLFGGPGAIQGVQLLSFRNCISVCPSLCRSRLSACHEESSEEPGWSSAKKRILVRKTVAAE